MGLKPTKSIFFEIFGAKEQKEKTGKKRKYRKKLKNFGEKSEKQNFGGDILSISTDSRYFGRNIGNFVP